MANPASSAQKDSSAINERNIPLLSSGEDFSCIYPCRIPPFSFVFMSLLLWTSKWRVRSDARNIEDGGRRSSFLFDTRTSNSI